MEIDKTSMPHREKSAWLSLIAIAVTFGPYFAITAVSVQLPMPNLPQLERFAVTAISQMLILGVGHLVLNLRSPIEARMRPDERDSEIMRRSMTTAYYVLIGGMIVVGCVMPFSAGGWAIVNAALFMINLAEVVHYGVVVASYRRQA